MLSGAFCRRWGAVRVAVTVVAVLWLAACSKNNGFPDFTEIVQDASPSVVNISTISKDPVVLPGDTSLKPDASQDWYKRYQQEHEGDSGEDNSNDDDNAQPPPPSSADGDSATPQAESLGSGFVLWQDGYILTNYHVVRDAREVIVRLMDRRQFTAKVVGTDERSDLALLKIDETGLPALKQGDSSKVKPGEWVLAIGSPFGFDYSVTAGIVSAKGRSLVTEQYVPFIQTDVAINPGNSGGPLLNLKGEVIGINSQIYSESGGYQGLSFSIPIDVAAKVAKQLRDNGAVSRGWLGVVVQEVDRTLAKSLGMERPIGALVARVVDGGPGARAGLRPGDVILSFGNEELPTSTSLPPLVGNSDPGQIVPLQVQRDGKRIQIKVEIGRLSNQDQNPTAFGAQPRSSSDGNDGDQVPQLLLGLQVRALSSDERSKLQVFGPGVLVVDVLPGPAVRAGIHPGDVLVTVGGQDIDTPERLTAVEKVLTPGAHVPILVSRNGLPQFLEIEVPAR